MGIDNKIGLHGILECVSDDRGHKWIEKSSNRIVNQGMRNLLEVPDTNVSFHSFSNSHYPNGNYHTSVMLGGCIQANSTPHFCANYGIANFIKCGTGNSKTNDKMTELEEPVEPNGNLADYGSVQNALASNTSTFCFLTMKKDSIIYEFNYAYKAPTSFTCKEVGIYSFFPTVAPTNVYSYNFDDITTSLFARIVLNKPIAMVSGTTYFFKYYLTFTKSYDETISETMKIFGLPATMRKRYNSNEYTRHSVSAHGIKNASTISTTYKSSEDAYQYSPTGCLNYGLRCGIFTWVDYDDPGYAGIPFGYPKLYWLSSFDGTYDTTNKTSPGYKSSTYFNQTGDPVIITKPDSIEQDGDTFKSYATYTYTKPYSDTTDKYLAILWGNWIWFVNDTTSVHSTYGRDNNYKYTLTTCTSITRG